MPHGEARDVGEDGGSGLSTVVAVAWPLQSHGDRELGVFGGQDADEGSRVSVVASAFGSRGLAVPVLPATR